MGNLDSVIGKGYQPGYKAFTTSSGQVPMSSQQRLANKAVATNPAVYKTGGNLDSAIGQGPDTNYTNFTKGLAKQVAQEKAQQAKNITTQQTIAQQNAKMVAEPKPTPPANPAPHGLLGDISTYAKAAITSPVGTVKDIASGQRIKAVDNGALIVQRAPLSYTAPIKKAQAGNIPAGVPGQLDHTVPLEIGGTNAKSNLKLIPKALDDANNSVENYLGAQLKANVINAQQAQKLNSDYKANKITAQEVFKQAAKGGTPPSTGGSLAERAAHDVATIGKGAVQLPVDVGKGLAQETSNIVNPQEIRVNGMSVAIAQAKARQILNSNKFSAATKQLVNTGTLPAPGKNQGKPTKGDLVNHGNLDTALLRALTDPNATDATVQATVLAANKATKANENKVLGGVAQAASLGVPEAKGVGALADRVAPSVVAKVADIGASRTLPGAAVRATVSGAKVAPAGAAFGAGQGLENNETPAQIAKTAAETALLAHGTGAAGSLAKTSVSDLVTATGHDQGVNQLIADMHARAAQDQASGRMKIGGKTIEAAKQPVPIPVEAPPSTPQAVGVTTPIHPGIKQISTTNKIGVTTPFHPGIKQVSETSKIGVRTPQPLTEQDYLIELNKLNSAHARASKALGDLQATKGAEPALSSSQQQYVKAYADMIKSMDTGVNGGQMVPTSDGGYKRISEHSQFYRQVFSQTGRAPTNSDWALEARRQLESGGAAYGASDDYSKIPGAPKSNIPLAIHQTTQETLDNRRQMAINELNQRFETPELSPPVRPRVVARSTEVGKSSGGSEPSKQISSTTTKAPKATGGFQLPAKAPTGRMRTLGPRTTPAVTAPVVRAESPVVKAGGDNGVVVKSGSPAVTTSAEASREKVPIKPIPSAGETLTNKLATGIEQKALANKIKIALGDLPEHNKVDMNQQAHDASELLSRDPQHAIDIATGKVSPPAHILPESVLVAVENKAIQDGDGELLRQLDQGTMSGEATGMGQRLRALAERNSDSPVSAIKQVREVREKAAQRTMRGGMTVNKAITATAKEAESNIKPPSRMDWGQWVESLRC